MRMTLGDDDLTAEQFFYLLRGEFFLSLAVNNDHLSGGGSPCHARLVRGFGDFPRSDSQAGNRHR